MGRDLSNEMIAEHGQYITSPSGHAFNAAATEAAIECEDEFGHVNCNPFCSGRLRAPPTGALPYLQQDGHACGGSYMTSGSYCVPKSPQSAADRLQMTPSQTATKRQRREKTATGLTASLDRHADETEGSVVGARPLLVVVTARCFSLAGRVDWQALLPVDQ
jgi:hypothetical protein